MCAQPPVLPQSLPPPPPHFGELRGPKQSRRATCPALKTRRQDSMYEPCVGQAHPSPPSTGCHPMERSLPKGSIYDQPMQYMIVLPESQTSHGRSSSKRSQIRLGQSGGPEGSLEPRGSPSRRQHLQSMLEEKSDTLDGLASQRSGAHSQKSLDRGSSARHSEAAERSVQNSDAGSLGRRSSIVEEKRLQQRQWHQQLQKARQLEESESQLRRQEERSRADQWSERKLQEEQLRSKECQIQDVHQRLRRPARDALAKEPEAAEVTASMDLVQLTSSIVEPPSTRSDEQFASGTQENSERCADRRAGRQTLHSCRILGVSPDDGPDFIQQQYRRGALKRHPDKGGSHDQFTQLQAARDYMEARQSAHGDDMGGARSLQGDQRGGLGRLKPPAEVSRAQPPAPESVKEMAAITLCASPPLSTSSAGSLPLGARSASLDLGTTPVPVQELMVRQERTINLNPDPPPYPISAACSSLIKAAPSTTRKANEACEMMLDLTGEVPVHIPFSQSGGRQNAVASAVAHAPDPPLAPSESVSESWDPESEDISDSSETIRAAASSQQVNHSLRRGVASVSQKAESSVALPPAPEAKVPVLDHDEHPHRHRPSSRASQASSSEEASHGSQRQSPGWHTIDSCEVLGVTPDDGYESIQKNYRQQALRHHPDKGGRASLFRQLHDARDYLSSKQPARWQRPAHSESRPHQPPATSRARKTSSQAMPEVQEPLCSAAREKAPSDHSSFDTVEIKSRRWQRMTGSTVCPQSPRNTSSSLSDDGTLGHPSPVSGQLQQAFLPVPGYYDDRGVSPRGPAAEAPVRAAPRQGGHSVRWEGSFSPQARAPEAWSDRSACSRQALESSAHAHLRNMDAHCAALTDTYHRLASLHGELGQVFMDLQHAWGPLHDEAAPV
ncbi:SLC16A12 [Symbiodinium sp. CCMP2456]|nr:SLC16A12 [Symbiodinium sp. CCMP2456]